MNRYIIAITGPTGSGKSSVASILAKNINNSVNIDVDRVKHFVVSNFKYDNTREGQRQWELLGDNIGLLAANYKKSGYNIIINGVLYKNSWLAINRHISFTHKFLILPEIEITKLRDKGREKDYIMGANSVKTHHNYFSTDPYYKDYLVVDSSDLNIEDTVNKILKHIN